METLEAVLHELQPERFDFFASPAVTMTGGAGSIRQETSQWFSKPPVLAQSGALAAAAAQAKKVAAAVLAKAAISAEKTCWIQTVLNTAEGESLKLDGIFGPFTRQAIRRFQGRHSLRVDGVVGPHTETALIQAALNTTAQASRVPVNGVMDGNTRQEIIRFQSSNNLVGDGIVGPKTRATMVIALGGQCVARQRPSLPRPPTPPPLKPTTAACNREEYARQVNQCIENAKKCVIAAYEDLGVELLGCLGNPICNAKAVAKNLLAIRRCRDAIVPCDQAARRATNCP